MQEILPGVFHWTAIHPRIHVEVSSYWFDDGGVLVDPLVPPEEGLEWFAARLHKPIAIALSNRHHYRESDRFAAAFPDVTVHAPRAGLHEFGPDRPVTPYGPGDTLPGGLVVHEVGAICPDECALLHPGAGTLNLADGVVRGSEVGLGFVPDSLMDDPPGTKRGLLAAYDRLLNEQEFDHLLLAHGGPVTKGGRAQLRELVDSGGRTAFEF